MGNEKFLNPSDTKESIMPLHSSVSPGGKYLALHLFSCRMAIKEPQEARDGKILFFVIDLNEERIIYQSDSFVIDFIKWNQTGESFVAMGRVEDKDSVYDISLPDNTATYKNLPYDMGNWRLSFSPDEKVTAWVELKSSEDEHKVKFPGKLSYEFKKLSYSILSSIVNYMAAKHNIVFPTALNLQDRLRNSVSEQKLLMEINGEEKETVLKERGFWGYSSPYYWLDNEHIIYGREPHIVIHNVFDDSKEEVLLGDGREIRQLLINPGKVFIKYLDHTDFKYKCAYLNPLEKRIESTKCSNVSNLIGLTGVKLFYEQYLEETNRLCAYDIESGNEEVITEGFMRSSASCYEGNLYYLRETGDALVLYKWDERNGERSSITICRLNIN